MRERRDKCQKHIWHETLNTEKRTNKRKENIVDRSVKTGRPSIKKDFFFLHIEKVK